jgi:ribosomal protein L37E
MKDWEFKSLDPLAETLSKQCENWFTSEELAALRDALRKVSALLPPSYSLSIDVELRVFDPNRQQSLSLLTRGLCTSEGKEPYGTTGDSTIHRYVVGGEMCELPHDRCPHCWGKWDFKLQHPTCPQCGYSLGKEVRLLLDNDLCPHCEEGTLSLSQPTCPKCGFQVDAAFVTWG